MKLRFFICILNVAFGMTLYAQESLSEDSIAYFEFLKEVEIVREKPKQIIETSQDKVVFDLNTTNLLPKFLGVSDPLRYLQTVAGIQTNNETSTGVFLQGCDSYQTLTSINGAPIFYPNHLLGLYSAFIPAHFKEMTVRKSIHKSSFENRIGGSVNLQTQSSHPDRIHFDGNAGLITSDFTLSFPCGKKNAIYISARQSYLNLYKKLFTYENVTAGYNFQDYNFTYCYTPSHLDTLILTSYLGTDKISLKDRGTMLETSVKWGNIASSLKWNHHFAKGTLSSTILQSDYTNKCHALETNFDIASKADIAAVGIKENLILKLYKRFFLNTGFDFYHYSDLPLIFISDAQNTSNWAKRQQAEELSVFADITHNINEKISYNWGLRGILFSHSHQFISLDPRVTLNIYLTTNQNFSLHYGIYHQYFHKAGFTSGGLPIDYFVLASKQFQPEYAHSLSMTWQKRFKDKYSINAECYFKQIYNVVESTTNIFSAVNDNYNYIDGLISGNGRNYGIDLIFQKSKGVITGYVSYTLGWAKRRFPDLGKPGYAYSASHERRHDLKTVLNYNFNKRWNIGAVFVLASGVPYTRAEYAYILNGCVVVNYDKFNGAHLPLYHRLDLSVNYFAIKKRNKELGINLSLYNVYNRKNPQFIVYRNNFKETHLSFLSMIIPSISIFFKL